MHWSWSTIGNGRGKKTTWKRHATPERKEDDDKTAAAVAHSKAQHDGGAPLTWCVPPTPALPSDRVEKKGSGAAFPNRSVHGRPYGMATWTH